MNPIKLLASLTARGCNWIETGGTGKYSKDELIGALRGLDSVTIDLLYLTYGKDINALNRLTGRENGLYDHIDQLAKRQKWKIRGNREEKLKNLLRLVLIEALEIPCPTCRGTTYKENKPCNDCSVSLGGQSISTGKYRLRGYQKAHVMGIHKENWKLWRDKYKEVIKLIQDLESAGYSKISSNQR